MKKLLFIIALFVSIAATAQQRGNGQRREFNPEEMALQQTQQLHKIVELDSLQFQAVFIINYSDNLAMQDSMKVWRERREQNREQMKNLTEEERKQQFEAQRAVQEQRRQVRNEQMKAILTPEQYKKYEEYISEMAKRRRAPRGERARGGNRRNHQQ